MEFFKHPPRLLSILALAFSTIWISLTIWVFPSPANQTVYAVPQQGFFAPQISLTSLQGDVVTLADYKGQVVLVNIWASWCLPCKAEMPAIQRMYETYQDDGFVVLAVNATHQDNLNNVKEFVHDQALTFPILLDIEGEVSKKYQMQALPTSFFITPDGIINEVVIGGPMSEALLESRISALVGR